MSSTPGNLKAALAGRTQTRRLRSSKRGCRPKARIRRSFNNGGGGGKRTAVKCSKVVSAKLETLKNLIPKGNSSASAVQADKLFRDTADYIVLLRTQVVVLQKLIEVYESSSTEKEDITNGDVL